MLKIFISYRREDSAYVAQSIYDKLSGHFGKESVTFDVDSIPPGIDYVDYLTRGVDECDILLAVIGDRWLDSRAEDGSRRLENPKDFVRIEIQAALERKMPVFPVLIEKATMPVADQLPSSLKGIVRRNATEVRAGRDFQSHLTRLVSDVVTCLEHAAQVENEPRSPSQIAENTLVLERLKKKIDEQIYTLEYRAALITLGQMMAVEERRYEIYPYLFELAFFWNETDSQQNTMQVLTHWVNSGLLSDDLLARSWGTLNLQTGLVGPKRFGAIPVKAPAREELRKWLEHVDVGRYCDMRTRYQAADDTVMVNIKGGEFLMGSEKGLDREKPVDAVKVNSFALANVPVTWWQFALYLFANHQQKQLTNRSPSWGAKGDHPVVKVSWYDAVRYCNWISSRRELAAVYSIDEYQRPDHQPVGMLDGATGFRLPSEAEWEYACRAESTREYSFGNDQGQLSDHGWFNGNSNDTTHPVGRKKSNPWGLFDMHGNVWEWCQDRYRPYGSEHAQSHRTSRDRGRGRILRGGSYLGEASRARSAFRGGDDPGIQQDYVGFRVART